MEGKLLTWKIQAIQAITALILLFISARLEAQVASASVDTTSFRIGEQVLMKLNVTLPKTAKVTWPALYDTVFSPVEIVRASSVDTLETSRANYMQYKQVLTITSFDSGYHSVPPIEFRYSMPGDTTHFHAITDTLILHVSTVLVDTTLAIKDIKAPMQAPLTLAELWPLFLGLAVVGILVAAIWYYLWRRKMNKPIFPVIRKPQLPPWQEALQELDRIESKKHWQNGRVKDYYTELTDVLRNYLEKQFQVPAMEMISSEIMEAMEGNILLKPVKDKAWQVLELADLVKFAKEVPLPNDNQLSMNNTRDCILITRPNDQNEKPSTATNDNEPLPAV